MGTPRVVTRPATFATACILVLSAGRLFAHDLGTLQTTATFPGDGTYRIEMAVDAEGLLTKLEAHGGAPISGAVSPDERDRRIHELSHVLLDRVRVDFDGRGSRSAFRYEAGPIDGPSTVILSGRVPAAARAMTFVDHLAMGTFAFRVLVNERVAAERWLNGGETSPPVSIERATLPRASGSGPGAFRSHVRRGLERALEDGRPLVTLGVVLIAAGLAARTSPRARQRQFYRVVPGAAAARSSKRWPLRMFSSP